MAFEDEHTVYGGEEDLDEDDDDESEDPPPDLDDDDEIEDEEEEDDDTSSSNLAPGDPPPPPPSSVAVTVAIAPKPSPSTPTTATATVATVSLPDPKRQRIDDVTIAAVFEEKKPLAVLDDSRRLFQRLWTDEDEIELLQGFLDYTNQRGGGNSSHHHDTTAFYDQIKSKLQLEFNKNQLVEKLRRLKKKYRNVLGKIGSGKEYVFKSPHDQATFEISKKIWSSAADRGGAGGGAGEEGGLEDDESNPNPNPNPNPNANPNLFDHNSNGVVDPNSSEKKGSRSRKRSRVKIEEKHQFTNQQQPQQQNATPIAAATATSIPNLIEETVRSCLSPLFKELLHNAMNGAGGSRGFGAVAALNPMPLSFGSPAALNFPGGDSMDEKWRKQQILELEVYSKRLELVQDQIKSALEELRAI